MARSVGHGEALPDVAWMFDLIEQRNGEILHGNAASPRLIEQYLIATGPVDATARTWFDHDGRAEYDQSRLLARYKASASRWA